MSENKWQRWGTYTVFGLMSAGGLLLVSDMWFGIFAEVALWKTLITLAVFAGIIGVFILIRRDLNEDEKMRKDGYMD